MSYEFMTSVPTSKAVKINSRVLKSYTVEITDFDNEVEVFSVDASSTSEAAQKAESMFGGDVYMMNVYSY